MSRRPSRAARGSPRWRGLLDASDAALGALLAATALALRERREELAGWATLAGLPEGEVVASPFGARMIALGLEVGATSVHHELRPLLRWDRSITPDDAVADPRHGLWLGGALRTGKYQEFCQEEPFCTYHPEHSAKWAPHEWLHRAVGFHAPADAAAEAGSSRYVGARLNELLPVATWYGLEHALRLEHEGSFDRVAEGRSPDAPLAHARWLHESERSLARRARAAAPLVHWTLARVARELSAIDDELASATIVPSHDVGLESFPGVRLDASADALAYVHAHARRLQSPATRAVLASLAPENLGVRALRRRVDATLDRLLFGDLAPRPARVRQRIRTNAMRDLLLRAALVDPSTPQRELVGRARRWTTAGDPEAPTRLAEALARVLAPKVGERRAEDVVTLGLPAGPRRAAPDQRALARGVRTVLPATARLLRPRERARWIAQLATTPGRGHLAARAADALEASGIDDAHALAELARLEQLLDAAPVHEPRDAWRLPIAHAPRHALASPCAGLVVRRFDVDVLAAHRGEPFSLEPTHVAFAWVRGAPVLTALPATAAAMLLDTPSAPLGTWVRRLGSDVVASLAEIGLILVLAPP